MSSVKRYSATPTDIWDDPNGEWALYSDVAALELKLKDEQGFRALYQHRAATSAKALAASEQRCAELEQDARRYRWLRSCHWNDSPVCVTSPANLRLGSDCPSEQRLDALIDAAAEGAESMSDIARELRRDYCSCHEAYTSRRMTDPNCESCSTRDMRHGAAARIAALEAALRRCCVDGHLPWCALTGRYSLEPYPDCTCNVAALLPKEGE